MGSGRRVLRGLAVAVGMGLVASLLALLAAPTPSQATVFRKAGQWLLGPLGYEVPICIVPGSSAQQTVDGEDGDNPSLHGVVTRVRNALESTYGTIAPIRFTGWADCTAADEGNKAALFIHPDAEDNAQVGRDGALGAGITPTDRAIQFSPWGISDGSSTCITDDHYYFDCVEQIALHEFGHLLGFKHEWYHPTRPSECIDTQTTLNPNEAVEPPLTDGADYQILNAEFDDDSIMTYGPGCADVDEDEDRFLRWLGGTTLSSDDRAGVAAAYPAPPLLSHLIVDDAQQPPSSTPVVIDAFTAVAGNVSWKLVYTSSPAPSAPVFVDKPSWVTFAARPYQQGCCDAVQTPGPRYEVFFSITPSLVPAGTTGARFSVQIPNANGSVTQTFEITLSPGVAPTITTPAQATICVLGSDCRVTSFDVTATGDPAPRVHHGSATISNQIVSQSSSSNSDVPPATRRLSAFQTGVYGIPMEASNDVAPDAAQILSLRVVEPVAPVLTDQPDDVTVNDGETATFTAAIAPGALPPPIFQWQESTDGVSWVDVPGATGPTLSVVGSSGNDLHQYRLAVDNGAGSSAVISDVVTLTVIGIEVAAQPLSTAVRAGETVDFAASALGTPTPTMAWEYSDDDGATWQPLFDLTSSPASFTAQSDMDGWRIRAVFTNSDGVAISDTAVLTVYDQPSFTQHPVDRVVPVGSVATFTFAAEGRPETYLWERSVDGGVTWAPVAAGNGPILRRTAIASDDGALFRVRIANVVGEAVSNPARLDLARPPVVTSPPTSQVRAPGGAVTFTVTATGLPVPTITWERSIDGGTTWTLVPGAIGASYTVTPTAADNGNRYRAVLTNSAGTVRSAPAILTVDTTPPVVALASRTPANGLGWNHGPVTVTWSCTDAESGVVAGNVSATVSTEGRDQTASATCTNGVGQSTPASLGDIDVDLHDPVAMLTARTPANDAGWNNTAVAVTWSCTDTFGGGTTPEVTTTTLTATVSGDGADQSVSRACTDASGRSVTASLDDIDIDTTPPVATLTSRTPANGAGWNNTAVTVTWSCADTLSGSVQGTLSATVATEGSSQTASSTCADVAGNSVLASQGGIAIDRTPPTASGAVPPTSTGWYTGPVTVTWSCADTLSGLAAPCEPSVITGDGAGQTTTRTAVDVAGNSATGTSPPVSIDGTSPTIDLRSPVDGATHLIGDVVTADFDCADATSGVASCTGTVADGGALNTSSEGVRTFTVTAVDAAGNRATRTVTYTVRSRTALAVSPVVGISGLLGIRVVLALEARLTTTPGGAPLPGRTITFRDGTSVLCTATTNAAGVARCNGLVPLLRGILGLGYRADYAGEQLYLPSSGQTGLLG